jgi:hypothetical protein
MPMDLAQSDPLASLIEFHGRRSCVYAPALLRGSKKLLFSIGILWVLMCVGSRYYTNFNIVLDTNHINQTGTSSRPLLCASSLYCLRQSGWPPCLCHFRPHGFPCCVPPRSRISSRSPQVSCMAGTPDQVSDDKVPIPRLHVTSPAQPSASGLQWHSHN